MGTLSIPSVGEANTTADPKVKTALETYNNSLDAENKLKGSSIATSTIESSNIKNETILNEDLALTARPFRWYTPKVIATEQSRENVAFGTLTTADEITGVVLPENGLILVGYSALFKSSVSNAGRAAIFLGENQLKSGSTPAVQEASTLVTEFGRLGSSSIGLHALGPGGADVTTGQIIGAGVSGSGQAGVAFIFAASGTYTVSVRYKASSGTVTAKERKLWVATLGV